MADTRSIYKVLLDGSGEYEESLASSSEEPDFIELKELRIPPPAVRCYLDFDGTLTKLSGQDAIRSELYAALRTDGKKDLRDYFSAEFKPAEERIKIFKEGLSADKNKDLAITPDAITFLKEILSLSVDVEIIIISKNRTDYIKDHLLFAELPVEKFKIHDCNEIRDKGQVISFYEHYPSSDEERSKAVVIADDNKKDFELMAIALRKAGYGSNPIAHHCKPGEFPWNDVLEQIKEKLGLGSRSTTTAEDTQEAGLKLNQY